MSDFITYIKDVMEELLKLLVVALSAAAVNCLLLYGSWYAWQVFLSAHTGDIFKEHHPEVFKQLQDVFALEPYWELALQLAGVSALFMLVVALVSQFIYIRHLLYTPLWGILKLPWAFGLSFALAWLLQYGGYDTRLSDYSSYVLLLIPSMTCVLFASMKSAPRIVPDIASLFVSITSRF